MKHAISKPWVEINWLKAAAIGISRSDVSRYLPKYLVDPDPLECGVIKYWCFTLVLWLSVLSVKIFLRPRNGQVGNLDLQEVDRVYDKEAKHYDWKHHMTTRGQDKTWRRQAGWFLANLARIASKRLRVLDLCTGTGLTIEETLVVFNEFTLPVSLVGLDYNEKMLQVARSRRNGTRRNEDEEVMFVRKGSTLSC